EVTGLIRRRDLVGAEEKSIRMPVDDRRGCLDRLGGRDDVLRGLAPGEIDVDTRERRIREQAADDVELVGDGPHDATEPRMRPDDRGVRVPQEEIAELNQLIRLLP